MTKLEDALDTLRGKLGDKAVIKGRGFTKERG